MRQDILGLELLINFFFERLEQVVSGTALGSFINEVEGLLLTTSTRMRLRFTIPS
jgi:hypothetical protein